MQFLLLPWKLNLILTFNLTFLCFNLHSSMCFNKYKYYELFFVLYMACKIAIFFHLVSSGQNTKRHNTLRAPLPWSLPRPYQPSQVGPPLLPSLRALPALTGRSPSPALSPGPSSHHRSGPLSCPLSRPCQPSQVGPPPLPSPQALPAITGRAPLPCPLSGPSQSSQVGSLYPVLSPGPTSPHRSGHSTLSSLQALPALTGRAPLPCPLPRPYQPSQVGPPPPLPSPQALPALTG